MPSIYDLKSGFQNLLRPITRFLARIGVTANQVTLFALLLSFISGGLTLYFSQELWPLIVIGPLLFVRMALNAIDGMLAREHNMKSDLGAMLNELGDVLADAALYLPLAARPQFCAYLVVPAVVLSIVSEMTGVVSVQIGGARRYEGPMGKSDRAFAFGLTALLIGCGVSAGNWVHGVMAVVNVLLVVTILNRMRKALQKVPQ